MKPALPRSEELLSDIQKHLGLNRAPALIAIDGPDGVGKSSLASWLGWQLGMPTIHLDLYVIKGSDPLQWRKDDLDRVINARGPRPLLLEGIMILEVLGTIGRKPDFLAYVDGEGSYALSQPLKRYRERHRPQERANFALDGWKDPPVKLPYE